MCFHAGGFPCLSETEIQVRNCGSYFLYYLPNTPGCFARYCSEQSYNFLKKYVGEKKRLVGILDASGMSLNDLFGYPKATPLIHNKVDDMFMCIGIRHMNLD